jgi:hypothetical protein
MDQDVLDKIEEDSQFIANIRVAKGTEHGHSIEIEPTNSEHSSAEVMEMTRPFAKQLFRETGYAITGFRDHGDYLEIWFDNLLEQIDRPHTTVAQRAAKILESKKENSTFEPNLSNEPDEQYVDVYTDPHKSAMMNFSISRSTFETLRDAGLRIQNMSLGRDMSRFGDETHRIWFEAVDE